MDHDTRGGTGLQGWWRWTRGWAVVIAVLVAAGAFPANAQSADTTPPATEPPASTEPAPTPTPSAPAKSGTASERKAKATAAAKLNAALADDTEIVSGLQAISQQVQDTQSQVEENQRKLEAARQVLATAVDDQAAAATRQADVERQLQVRAVQGFEAGVDAPPNILFSNGNVNDTIRQTQLLNQANKSTAELVDELRNLKDDQVVAAAAAVKTKAESEALTGVLAGQLEDLKDQQAAQMRLKQEAERRIAKWESELDDFAADDASIQALIGAANKARASTVTIARPPSSYGLQWPVSGPITSPFGYRVHPVYGTRKLHTGIDISAAYGTPIAAAGDGTVIFAGWQSGYGNTTIIDVGNGLATLYAHQSSIKVSEGQTVKRGQVIGAVGSTGTSTGNHLHFEVRVDGTPTNPVPYLPEV